MAEIEMLRQIHNDLCCISALVGLCFGSLLVISGKR